jgi:16S rRNA (cytosine1402-N4)-methyltransferase
MAYHVPVLLNTSIQGLNISPEGIYVDVTFGGGGHSKAILQELNQGKLFGFDQDADAQANHLQDEKFTLIAQNFKYLKNFLRFYQAVPVDGILADLGVSSHQFDSAERGFSTRFDGPLDMRMDRAKGQPASQWLQEVELQQLTNVFRVYGELDNAYKAALSVVEYRQNHLLSTTQDLKNALQNVTPRGKENKYFAKVFQAIRIEINQEMEALKSMLQQSLDILKPGGRLVVISYHSLEDRLVKNFMKTGNFEGNLEKDFFGNPLTPFKMISRKPIIADEAENEVNSRARSAKLRIAEKI